MEIDWTQAAIAAAVLGGVLGLVRGILDFLLALTKEALSGRRERIRVLARAAQFYYHTGLGAHRLLAADAEARREAAQLELRAPRLTFLSHFGYVDEEIGQRMLEQADLRPGIVANLLEIQKLVAGVRSVHEMELADYGGSEIPYSFPRTRRLLMGLLEHCGRFLQEIAREMPYRIMWWRGPRHQYRLAAEQLLLRHQALPEVSLQDMREEVFEARRRLLEEGGQPREPI